MTKAELIAENARLLDESYRFTKDLQRARDDLSNETEAYQTMKEMFDRADAEAVAWRQAFDKLAERLSVIGDGERREG